MDLSFEYQMNKDGLLSESVKFNIELLNIKQKFLYVLPKTYRLHNANCQ
jgi:hypothetical protein